MTQTDALKVDVKMKVSDVWRYNVWVGYRTLFSKIVVLIGCGILGWFIYKLATHTGRLDLFFADNIIWLILIFFILIAKPFKIWNITATQMQSPVFSGITHYVFSKDHIALKVGELEDNVSWETYIRIVETKKDFRFFVDAVQAQIIPKHNMTQEQVDALRALIKEVKEKETYRLR